MIPDFLMQTHVLQSFLSSADILSLLCTCKHFYTEFLKLSLLMLWRQHTGLSCQHMMTGDAFRFHHLRSIFPIFHQFILYKRSFHMNIIFLEQIKSIPGWFSDMKSLSFHDNDRMWFHIRSIHGVDLYYDHWWTKIWRLVYPRTIHPSIYPVSFHKKKSAFLYEFYQGLVYFEITILKYPKEFDNHSCLSIGFATADDFVLLHDFHFFLGWSDASVGIHSDDGHLYYNCKNCSYNRKVRPFREGDIIGAGICFHTKTFFFTINGKKHLCVGWADWHIYDTLYPTMIMDQLWEFDINFGHQPFQFQKGSSGSK